MQDRNIVGTQTIIEFYSDNNTHYVSFTRVAQGRGPLVVFNTILPKYRNNRNNFKLAIMKL